MNQQDVSDKINPQHEIFISEMIAHGQRGLAYRTAYPGTSQSTARTGACRLLAKPYIATRIREGIMKIREEAMQQVKERYAGHMADIDEKRTILAKIMRGELQREKQTTRKGETSTIKYTCEPQERMRAIVIDNKLEAEMNHIVELPDNGVRFYES